MWLDNTDRRMDLQFKAYRGQQSDSPIQSLEWVTFIVSFRWLKWANLGVSEALEKISLPSSASENSSKLQLMKNHVFEEICIRYIMRDFYGTLQMIGNYLGQIILILNLVIKCLRRSDGFHDAWKRSMMWMRTSLFKKCFCFLAFL